MRHTSAREKKQVSALSESAEEGNISLLRLLADANVAQSALKIQLDQPTRGMQSLRVAAERQVADLHARLNTASADHQRVLAEHHSGMLTIRELRSELERQSLKHLQEVEMLRQSLRIEHEKETSRLVASAGDGCPRCALLLQQIARLTAELQTIGQKHSVV